MPIVERVFVPSRSRAEGPGSQPPPPRAADAPESRGDWANRGLPPPGTGSWMLREMPVPPARSSRCSARCAVKTRSAAGRGALLNISPPAPQKPANPDTADGPGSESFFPPFGRGGGSPSPRSAVRARGRTSHRGRGAGRCPRRGRGARGSPRFPAETPAIREHPPPAGGWAPRTSNTSPCCSITAKMRSFSVGCSTVLYMYVFTCLLFKIRHFSKPLFKLLFPENTCQTGHF